MTIDRTPRPCLHPRARHEHGQRLAYMLDRCRCLPCCAANSVYESRRIRLRAYGRGTPDGWVDAAPIRAHVAELQAAGMGWKRVAAMAGVPNGTMTRLLFGKAGQPPSKRINPNAARRLLAIPMPSVDQLADGTIVDQTGTMRRLRALVALGWSQAELSRRLGMADGNFSRIIAGRDGVLVTTRRAVAELYDRMWDQPAPPSAMRTRSVNRAAQLGWAPPLAWDDEAIDDPAARPNRGTALRGAEGTAFDEVAVARAMHGDRVALRPVERAEVVHRLTAAGLSAAEIAPRVGIDARSVQRIRDERRRAEEAA